MSEDKSITEVPKAFSSGKAYVFRRRRFISMQWALRNAAIGLSFSLTAELMTVVFRQVLAFH